MKYFASFLLIWLQFNLLYSQNKVTKVAEIKEVMVYTASAELRYVCTVELKKGKNIVIFTDLTPFIVENSINVGLSDKVVNIITVTDKINYLKKAKKDDLNHLKDNMAQNIDKVGLIDCEIETLEKEKSLLFNGESIGGVSDGVAVSEIEKASAFFSKRYLKINQELFSLKKTKKELLRLNDNIEKQLKERTTVSDKAISEIIVVVNSPIDEAVEFDLKVLTSNAGWAPLYDIKYGNLGEELDFIFRANVFNATNTDWNDVNIKLSTASPLTGLNLPTINEKNQKSKNDISYQGQKVKFIPIKTNGIVSEYSIDYKYSIPSDGKPYLIDVGKYNIKCNYSYIVIPTIEKSGFLMANIPGWNKHNLISGTTNIYRQGTFLGKTFLNTLTENDTLSVYLGKDNQIEAYRKEKIQEHERKLIGNNYIERSSIHVTIKNNYSKNAKIKLIDQVPAVGPRDNVKLTVQNIENAELENKTGIINWHFTLTAGESKVHSFEYVMKIPKSLGENVKWKRNARRVTIPCPDF